MSVVQPVSLFHVVPAAVCRDSVSTMVTMARTNTQLHDALKGASSHDRRSHDRGALKIPVRIYPTDYQDGDDLCEVRIQHADMGVTRDISTRGAGWRQTVSADDEFAVLDFEITPHEKTMLLLVRVCWSRQHPSGVDRGGVIEGLLESEDI